MEKHIALYLEPLEIKHLLPAVLDYAGQAGWREVSLIPYESGRKGLFPHKNFDGAILKISHPNIQNAAQKMLCPIVNISQALPESAYPMCTFDNHEIGTLAARHLIACGAKTFGMIYSKLEFAKYRRQGFAEELERQGHSLSSSHVFPDSELTKRGLKQAIKFWPCCFGLFTDSDETGRKSIELIEKLGRSVPNEIAVVSCNNKVEVCTISMPALSSIELPEAEVGTTACKLLDRLMQKQQKIPPRTIIKPERVIIRGSSDVQMLEDQEVTEALQILKTPKGLRLNAEELAQELKMTRRTLDRRCYRYLGHSAADHIRQLRLERIKEELSSGQQTVAEIALDVGYQSATHLSKVLFKATGMRPSDFQKNII